MDPVPADANSVFPAQDMSTLLNGVTDPNSSLEDFLNSFSDVASWDLDFPADMPPAVQPKLEAGVGGVSVERPVPAYGNKVMTVMQQPVDQRYQVPGNWPQTPHHITQHVRPRSSHGHMYQMSAGLPPHQQYNSVQQRPTGLTHGSMETRNHMAPSQPCTQQSVVPFRSMQPCQPAPHQYLQHRPPMMSSHAMQSNHARTMSPGLQRSVVPNQTAMMHGEVSASPMSNQLHNLQVMVNNQTSMMHHGHVSISPGLGPNGDVLMHAKMHRTSTRLMHAGMTRHGAVSNDARLFQSSDYPPPNMMQQHQALNARNLQDQSSTMVAHPAAAGFHSQSSVPPLEHVMLRGPAGPVVQQNHRTAMVANHPSMMPAEPELRPNHFSGRSHGMGSVMSPMSRGAVHSSGPNCSQMGIASQQMMLVKQQQPVPVQRPARTAMMQPSQEMMDKNVAVAFPWHSPCSASNMMAQPAGVQNIAQGLHSPAMNQFPLTVSPAAGSNDRTLSRRQNSSPFSADIDSLSFISDSFLSQVADEGYCSQQPLLQPASSAGK